MFYQGSSYICKIANSIADPTQASFWDILARGLRWRGDFISGSTYSYQVNDLVFYNGSPYICKVAVGMATETPNASTSWSLLASKGADGKSAYAYAKDAGYTGTEQEFAAKLAENIEVPTKLSDLTDDSTHRLVTDTEKSTWNAKANTSDIPTKVSELTNDKNYLTSYTETDPTVPSWAKASTKPSYTKSEVGLSNVDNVKQYSASNPPPYPVTKVNNKTGAVTLTAADVGADASGTANSVMTTHNTNTSAHADIRTAIDGKANKSEGSFFIEGSGTTDSTAKTSTWTGTSDRITELYDGLAIRYKIGVAGQTTTTLNINGLGAKTVYLFNTTKLTTQFPVNSIINLIYHADLNSGCWVCSDYDSNTNTYQRIYPTTTNAEYPITARYNTTTGSSYYAEYGRYSTGVTLNPSTNTITATKFKGALTGNADTATKATQDASGNVITSTYETKTDATTKLNQINSQISQLSSEKVDKSNLTLGLHTDGLFYIFVDGTPIGNGIALPTGSTGDVVGNVDSNNNIVLTGNLVDGNYTVKYEMADGSKVNIGNLVLDSNVYYSVTKNLTYCTINNSATEVIEGQSYSATITANSGYVLKSVSVTMGGSAVSVSNGVINITKVTGNIVITAVATEEVKMVNLIPTALDPNLKDVYNGVGYKANMRISDSSNGEKATSANNGDILTGLIPLGNNGDVFHIRGVAFIDYRSGRDSGYISCWDANGAFIDNSLKSYGDYSAIGTDANGDFTITMKHGSFIASGTAYVRFQFGNATGTVIMTRNQLITD